MGFLIGLSECCRVYWYNGSTGALERCAAKSLNMDMAAINSDVISHWHAEALRERNALRYVAGVRGVVRYRDFIQEPSGAVHIIME